jgi:microcystin-dependent protein
MSEPYLSEIRIFSFGFAPNGWAFCDGQVLPINQNQALFALLGTTYGGNGTVNFALPDLQGRVPVHFESGFALGQKAGEENHTLNTNEMPAHIHPVTANKNSAAVSDPTNALWANGAKHNFAATPNTTMKPASILPTGSDLPHNNLSPYLTLNFCIALQGVFPSRN